MATDHKADPNETFLRYVLERLLYRLSQSPHANEFMLKGATLFALWEDEPHRPTRDIDFLGLRERDADQLREMFGEVCTIEVPDDGVVFDAQGLTVGAIRGGEAFGGQRVTIEARLGNARLRAQVDIGYGDPLVRLGDLTDLPVLLDFPAPCLLVYPVEAVIAEKLHAMEEHGMLTSRMKDIYDVVALSERLEFDGVDLTAAIRATFESRGRPPGEIPPPITAAFAEDGSAVARWVAFTRKNRLGSVDLAAAVASARAFLLEPLTALREGEEFPRAWPPGGPWH